nr:MAG TPA_asm: hypothetical protein [Bacteriophage sp.]
MPNFLASLFDIITYAGCPLSISALFSCAYLAAASPTPCLPSEEIENTEIIFSTVSSTGLTLLLIFICCNIV